MSLTRLSSFLEESLFITRALRDEGSFFREDMRMARQTLESLLDTWACVCVGFVLLNPPWFVFVSPSSALSD